MSYQQLESASSVHGNALFQDLAFERLSDGAFNDRAGLAVGNRLLPKCGIYRYKLPKCVIYRYELLPYVYRYELLPKCAMHRHKLLLKCVMYSTSCCPSVV